MNEKIKIAQMPAPPEPRDISDNRWGYDADDMQNHYLAGYEAGRAGRGDAAGWVPIESAPTVGTILLWWKNAGACTGGFAIDEEWRRGSLTPREGWKGDGDEGIPRNQEDCTHWQVLRVPDGCKWPRFSDGHSTQEWLEERYSSTKIPAAPTGEAS
jgi:hypothetical protein